MIKINKKTPVIILLAMTCVILGLLLKIQSAKAQVVETQIKLKEIEQLVVVKKDILTVRQKAWKYALAWCESRHRDDAVNKVDRDGTPSYGRYQFKPTTFHYFMKKYDIGTSTNYMDGDLQERIIDQMIIRNDVKWFKQFPDCVKRNGTPPRN